MSAYEFLLTRREPRPDPTNRDDLEDKLERDWWEFIGKDIDAHQERSPFISVRHLVRKS